MSRLYSRLLEVAARAFGEITSAKEKASKIWKERAGKAIRLGTGVGLRKFKAGVIYASKFRRTCLIETIRNGWIFIL